LQRQNVAHEFETIAKILLAWLRPDDTKAGCRCFGFGEKGLPGAGAHNGQRDLKDVDPLNHIGDVDILDFAGDLEAASVQSKMERNM
jgi:hypothetical protein